MHTSILTALQIIFFASTVTAVRPPDFIALIIPPSQVPVNETLQVGWADTSTTALGPFYQEVDMFLTLPNTSILYLGKTTGCQSYPGTSYRFNPLIDKIGTYIALWNVTYGIPSTTNCSVGDVSYQSWTLNYTFQATSSNVAPSQSLTILDTTTTAHLPTEPTGNVQVASLAIRNTLGSNATFILLTLLTVAFTML